MFVDNRMRFVILAPRRSTMKLLAGVALLLIVTTVQAHTLLRYKTCVPLVYPLMAMTVKPWTDDIAKATDNRVRFEFTAQSTGPPPNQFDMVRDGVIAASTT